MTRKRALIVDDSKSARVILSRMLEKYDIEVDMAESAEQSIEYLRHNRPDAIFMDHLMPGMDGLQAVKAIKGNPQTAMIPIMMYTSQDGELYVGQARALGALGVLPKQVRPVDVSKILYELHLLPERRDEEEPALHPVELTEPAASAAAAVTRAPAGGADLGRRFEQALKDQAVDLRRFIVASLDSFAARIVSDVRDKPAAVRPALEPPAAAAPATAAARRPPWAWITGAGAAGLLAAAFAWAWVSVRSDLAQAHTEVKALSAANRDLGRSRDDLNHALKDMARILANVSAPAPAPAPALAAAGGGAAGSAGAAAIRAVTVPYGEVPLDRRRLDAMRELLSKLVAQGFRGIVKVTSFAGLFCLSGDANDGYLPAKPSLPAGKCDALGNPFEESLSGQQRQSLAFGNLIAGVRERTGGAISVAIEDGPSSQLAVPYPMRTDTLTAGEWNKAAAANNRVEFELDPAPTP